MNYINRYRPYFKLLAFIIMFTILFFTGYDSIRIKIDKPNKLTTGWVFENAQITLPASLNVQSKTPYLISRTLDNDFIDSQVIMIRTSLQDIKVYLDNNLIYEKNYGSSIKQPYASTWHFITLPSNSNGQELAIELNTPYRTMSGDVNEVFYGTEVMHYKYLMNTYGLRLIIGLIVLFIGLIVMISDLFISHDIDRGFVFIGLFAVLLSFWMIAESRMLQFFTGSELLIGSLAYISLAIAPIPLGAFLSKYILIDYKKPLKWMRYVYIINFIVITILHFTEIADYFETVIVSQALMILGIIMSVTTLILDYKKNKNVYALKILKGFVVLIIFAIFEFINFVFGHFENISLYLSIGIVIIIAYMFINYFKYFIHRLKKSYQTELYEKLAYIDHVIQGKNRLAFERDFEAIFDDEKRKKNLRLILFDLDNLKKINDIHGHISGDSAIKKAYELMTDVFKDYGECYRIGGDEFACLYLNNDEVLYNQKIKTLESLTKEINEKSPYRFGISLGSAVIDKDQMNHLELYEKADKMMYEYRKFKNLDNERF